MSKIEQCLEVFEKLLIKGEEVDISNLEPELFKYTHPDVMFLGGDETECISTEAWLDTCESQNEVLFSILTSLAQCEDISLAYAPEYDSFFKILDCAYGILVQAAADCPRVEEELPIGLLTFMFDNEGFEIRDQESLIGGTLLNGVRNLLLRMVDNGEAQGIELLGVLDEAAPFFIPLRNSRKVWYKYDEENSQDIESYLTDPCINYDLGFGGQLGWYRLGKLMGEDVASLLQFGEGVKEQAQEHLEDKLVKLERLKRATLEILTSEGSLIFNQIG